MAETTEFSGLSCRDFVEVLASKEPVPGGGGAAALVGAIGMALGNMVGSLTLGKKKYADVQDDITALKEKADAIQDDLLALMQRDAEVFRPLSKAYGMPFETEDERDAKNRVMAEVLKDCCAVPLEIMKKCCEAIDLIKGFADKGAAIAISDAGCGVIACKAALQAASLNVFINTKSMADRKLAEENNKLANDMLASYTKLADEIFDSVAARFQ
ncbi:sugar ABC transporter substrate-binding protein [Synergistales bacterium]|nr:sugar ABC transporter substrate-binding protein [Synergistales bacterium]